MIKTLYLNLEDDITKITARLKKEASSELVLVFPKKSFLFADSINLRLLKKQADILGKKLSILTMDEMGQMYAKEAGFDLKFLPKRIVNKNFSDIRPGIEFSHVTSQAGPVEAFEEPLVEKKLLRKISRPAFTKSEVQGRNAIRRVSVPNISVRQGSKENVQQDDLVQALFDEAPAFEQELSSKKARGYKKFTIGIISAVLILVLLVVFVIMPSAQILVYAKSQPITRDIDVLLSAVATTSDVRSPFLQAERVNETMTAEESFVTTGKKEVGTKAHGTVKIFNLTSNPLNLKAATTTLTLGNKNYSFTLDQAGIKPSSNKETGSVSAEIIASSGGEDYNLPAGTRIEITNQVFGSNPQFLYAKTETPIVGGTSRFISIISEEDLSKAKSELEIKIVDEFRAKLKDSNLIIPDKGYTATFNSFVPDKLVGTESPNFIATAKVDLKGLAFDSTQLSQLMRDRIATNLSGNRTLQDPSLDKIKYEVKLMDALAGTATLSVHYESQAIAELDLDGLLPQLLGKTKQEAGEILLSADDVDRVEVFLKPTWQSTLPRFRQRVNIEIQR